MVGYGAREVAFDSGGSTIAGVLYRPDRPGRHPCVLMAHGFSGTMDWILPDFAAVFAAAGLAVLTFDYRHFGAREGQPRQLVDSQRQLADIRSALAYVRSREDVDNERIALWGTSLGGSHVIVIAAEDPRLAAVVANMPALDMYKGLRGRYRPPHFHPRPARSALAAARLMGPALLDAARSVTALPPRLRAARSCRVQRSRAGESVPTGRAGFSPLA